jgi:hypothetical protein
MMTEWAAATMKLLLWGVLMAADIDLPPTRYDHAYRGQVEYVYDFPIAVAEDGQRGYSADDDHMWGYTVPPKRRGGKCLIHLSPIGSVVDNQVMTEEMLRVLIRHETGHCNGWRHRAETTERTACTDDGREATFLRIDDRTPAEREAGPGV